MPGNIEEVGARLVLRNRPAFVAGMRDLSKTTRDYAKVSVDANKQMAAATKLAADAQADLAAKTQIAADATAKAMEAKTAAVRAAAAGDKDAAVAARSYADAMTAEMVAANNAKRAASAQSAAAASQVTALRKASAAHDAHTKSVSGSTAAATGLAKIGKVAVLGGLAASTAIAYEGAKAFTSYQQALEAVHTQAGLTQSRVDSLGRSLLKLTGSGKIATDPTTLATQLYRVASATAGQNVSNPELLAMTVAASQLATIGGPGTDPEQTARILGSVRASGIKGATDYSKVAAWANAVVGSGDMRMQDLVEALSSGVLGTARTYGLGLNDVGAWISLLTDNAMSGSVAGHLVNHGIALLGSPNQQAAKVEAMLGMGNTELYKDMHSGGLMKALLDLKSHLNAKVNGKSMRGGLVAADTELIKLGFTDTAIKKINAGGADMAAQALFLSRMFGGAKQATPLILGLTEIDKLAAKYPVLIAGQKHFAETVAATNKEPATQWQKLNTQLKTYEIELGQKVTPIALGAIHWLQRHETLVKGIAIAFGTALIPATALWLGKLATDGMTNLGGFLGLLRNTDGAAGVAAGGLNGLGKAVAGVTSAVGIWELGKVTAGHGTMGMVTAGLGGAFTGMMAGLAIAGAPGGIIGAAAGAIGGLASNLFHAADGASAADAAMRGWMQTSYRADNFAIGRQFDQGILNYLGSNPKLAGILSAGGVGITALAGEVRSGNVIGGPAGLQLQAAYTAGKIGQQQYQQGLAGLTALVSNFGDIVVNLDNLAKISGKVSQHTRDIIAGTDATIATVYTHPKTTTTPTLSSLLGAAVPHRAHGGPVRAGELYQVNEQGIELFRPDVNGSISPAGTTTRADRPSRNIEVTLNVNGVTDPRRVADMVLNEIDTRLARL